MMKLKKLTVALTITLMSTTILSSLNLAVAAPSARELMEAVNARDDGNNGLMEMEMILIDKKGKQRIRKLKKMSQDRGDDSYSLLFFLSPSDVKDTGFLTYDYDQSGKDDDQWLYLPALKKTKRIANDDKSGSFMGSDFNYSDMSDPDLDDYNFTLMKETKVHGNEVWQIKSVPKSKEIIEETGYRQSVVFVRKDNFVVVRAVRWMESKGKLRYLDLKKLEQIDGVWTPLETTMTTKEGKRTLHKTVIRYSKVRYNQELDESLFTVRRLEKGAN
ncbi:MAG: outer membrane lipoprotein-sorting protein [Thiotrichales bacterium]|nr:outer membrane lipoprotein-sorting protein [Thiotrichales bacterium]MBT3613098.1 outer membrane lipoprotein-sorting protein [Thiotrichales bacterium]MBT3752141.1 outer membrane lipoprotein-sorting protein [Thiotrichales bacterium]MBT3837813.1 outer membrane lipoprotein-sorting protein [Thiotrichales bacterium]MBT4152772.1 outer membrane lipoprotein-sorting protein [Thiotrichales bacterium]